MALTLVEQLRFTRAEWQRGLAGVSDADATRRIAPMNTLSWMIGHLAWHERLVWIERGQGLTVEPVLDALANGAPASAPPLDDMWSAWARIVERSEVALGALARDGLDRPLSCDPRTDPPAAGTELLHVIYHYWGHIGEASALRQLLGHARPPEFVGDIDRLAPYHGDR